MNAALLELPFHEAKKQCVDAFEGLYLRLHLTRHCGNVAHTAQAMGISRITLYEMMRKHKFFATDAREAGKAVTQAVETVSDPLVHVDSETESTAARMPVAG